VNYLDDLFDTDLLAFHVDAGHIARTRHPTEPLTILNYTQRCQFEGAWDEVTRACRGLIVADNGEVVARPFPKFHNLHEHGAESAAGPIDLTPPLRVYDKLDGSLGIAYRRPSDGRVAWSTRGSFESEQALWATQWWDDHGAELTEGLTYLAEIIYPGNRIVVDYGDRSEPTLLAALDIATGRQVEHPPWPGPVVESFPMVDDLAVIDRNARPQAEGYVVLAADGLTRVKLKGDEYMRLHKLLTGMTNRTVWELLSNGTSLDEMLERVPDEFAAWLNTTVADLTNEHAILAGQARADYDAIRAMHPAVLDGQARGDFARSIQNHPHRSLLFALLDGKPIDALVWKLIKPERALPYATEGAPT